MVQLARLEGFYWVARTGGYARAARAFPYPITQPAVHQQVKKLESELGLALFERVARDRMALTAAGARLYEFVAPFFEGLPPLVRSLRQGEYGSELRIQTASLVLRHVLPAWIKRLHELRPEVEVHVSETSEPHLEDLRAGATDLIVDYLPEVPEDIASMRVGATRPFLVLPRGHGLARRRSLPLEALQDEVLCSYPPGSPAQRLQHEALARAGVRPARSISATTAEGILGLVEAGLGYSIVPSIAERGPTAAGLVARPLEGVDTEFPILAAWRLDMPENPVLDAFLELAPHGGPGEPAA